MRYVLQYLAGIVFISGMSAGGCSFSALQPEKERPSFERYLIVDCYFPDLMIFDDFGSQPAPQPPIRTSAGKCSDAGGQYELPNLSWTLKVWRSKAEGGDPEAQYFIGQAYESFGETPNYEEAAKWYRRAAEQLPPHRPSAAALARFFEQGLGVKKDWVQAAHWYIIAADMSNLHEQLRYLEFLLERLKKEKQSTSQSEDDFAASGHRSIAMTSERYVASITDVAPATSYELRDGSRDSGGESSFSSQIEDIRKQIAELEKKKAELEKLCQTSPQECIPKPSLRPSDLGKYYALVIGISEYDDPRWPKLPTAFGDAQDLARLLEDKYGFEKPVQVLATPPPEHGSKPSLSKGDILGALNDLRNRINEEVDHNTTVNFLLYFAGHGKRVTLGRMEQSEHLFGFWIPADAPNVDLSPKWVGKFDITLQLQAMKAKRVLVIADSCFAGLFQRSSQALLGPSDRDKSRIIITSGRDAPALEIDGAKHSIFSGALLEALRKSQDRLLANDLLNGVKKIMADATKHLGVNQMATYGILPDAGHTSGDFVFFSGL